MKDIKLVDLEPCPFCGAEVHPELLYSTIWTDKRLGYVITGEHRDNCPFNDGCGCGFYETTDELEDSWNMRRG